MTLTRLLSEKLIAEALLDWLGEDGYIREYSFAVEEAGPSALCVELPTGVRVEAHSILGPLECVTDLARAVVAEVLTWEGEIAEADS